MAGSKITRPSLRPNLTHPDDTVREALGKESRTAALGQENASATPDQARYVRKLSHQAAAKLGSRPDLGPRRRQAAQGHEGRPPP